MSRQKRRRTRDRDDGDWFDRPGDPEPGLRFECTQCGACCTGPPGYVLLTENEEKALAERLNMDHDAFRETYTRPFGHQRSLTEVETEHGHDCVFLDRTTIPGKAVCGVYEHRPLQCRTWPLWKQNLRSPSHWSRAARGCPGMNQGALITPEQIRIVRDRSPL